MMHLTSEWAAIIVAGIAFLGVTVKSYFDNRGTNRHLKDIGSTAARIEIQTDSRLTEALAKVDYLTDALAKANLINVADRVTALENLKKVNGDH
jgi:hypothetical protein